MTWQRGTDPLTALRAAFSEHEITEDRARDPIRYHARARNLAIRPAAVITADLAELERVLADGTVGQLGAS